jgi:hypothetical protein
LTADEALMTMNAMKPTFVTLLLSVLVSSATAQEVVFEDSLKGPLAEGWSWLRENPEAWRFRDNALEIRVQPGDANSVKNALVRPAPDRSKGTYVIDVTVTVTRPLTQQYEQAGITWYHNGKPVVKLVKELVDGDLVVIPGRRPMTNDTVQLRLVVSADKYVAQFRPDAKGDFQAAGAGALPPPGQDQVSIQCYHGPPNAEHWIRFQNFRITRLD